MRRDYVTFGTRHVDQDGDELPTIVLTIDPPGGETATDGLEERLRGPEDTTLDADELDVTVRLQAPADADDATGVFGITNRITGEFVLEANVPADPVFDLVEAAKHDEDASGESCYRIEVDRTDDAISYDKRTLLVYDEAGSLLRNYSLIPSGVEL
jgi:hypothetical protein